MKLFTTIELISAISHQSYEQTSTSTRFKFIIIIISTFIIITTNRTTSISWITNSCSTRRTTSTNYISHTTMTRGCTPNSSRILRANSSSTPCQTEGRIAK